MFRKMRRSKQALSPEECIDILKSETRGVLSVNGDDGYPYGIPINHFYDGETDSIYFHGAKIGHRVDAVRKDPKVSFCVYKQADKAEDGWSYYVNSVVVFGRARLVDSYEEMVSISRKICSKFPVPEGYTESEIAKDGPATLCIAVKIEHMTGKRVHES